MSKGTESFTEQPASGYSPRKDDSPSLSTQQGLIVLSHKRGFGLNFGCDLRKMNLLPFLNLMAIMPNHLKKTCIKLFFYATVYKGVHLDSGLSNSPLLRLFHFQHISTLFPPKFLFSLSPFHLSPHGCVCVHMHACACVRACFCVCASIGLTTRAWG